MTESKRQYEIHLAHLEHEHNFDIEQHKYLQECIRKETEAKRQYEIAMMYWENEKYMSPESDWERLEPKEWHFE